MGLDCVNMLCVAPSMLDSRCVHGIIIPACSAALNSLQPTFRLLYALLVQSLVYVTCELLMVESVWHQAHAVPLGGGRPVIALINCFICLAQRVKLSSCTIDPTCCPPNGILLQAAVRMHPETASQPAMPQLCRTACFNTLTAWVVVSAMLRTTVCDLRSPADNNLRQALSHCQAGPCSWCAALV
jgi:hypothetical protein